MQIPLAELVKTPWEASEIRRHHQRLRHRKAEAFPSIDLTKPRGPHNGVFSPARVSAARDGMSRQDGEFDKHGGRNAFRNAADDVNLTSTERAASLRAMRSFTESIEDDVGPPELPPHLDIDVIGCSTSGMSASNTTDTIIEVATGADPMTSSTSSDKNRPSKKPKVDPQLGETQKYKMAVPGPGHSEQEQELHKSLIRDNDDDNDAEVEALFGKGDIAPPTSLPFEEPPTHEQLRREYSAAAVQRRRPTTPTSGCVLDGIAFFGGDELPDVPKEEKIKVSIPAGSRTRRRSDMTYSDFYDQMAAQMPNQIKRASNSGRTTPLNDYDGDILEENPNYKDKVPPAPVIHRRSSVEWENFEDMQGESD
ncbi:unnamed protein product [Caenorhabditis auriculariae]|uniref:Uncharacterized protein n=1 Tax=Caenorhabditis auriculariae TaxID=2777116 RepID=A0A8S1H1T6_9PELO|nr:unnamed protein product [Caenorhabditis auriculariae]